MKAILIDKETGKRTELPNAIGTLHVSDPEPQPQADGRYSFNVSCKAHISRRNLKHLKRMLTPPRPPKYIPKSRMALTLVNEDVTNILSYDELMKLTHKELCIRVWPVLQRITLGFLGIQNPNWSKGGIVPNEGCGWNKGELVIDTDRLAKLREELKPNTEAIEGKAIGVDEIRKALHLP